MKQIGVTPAHLLAWRPGMEMAAYHSLQQQQMIL
jgi:hypothetical protein